MAQAIALSATSMGGLMAAANTSVAREYHAGLAAMLGVHAALAAQKGYVAEESILETRHGFFEVYGGTHGPGVTRDLGREWDIITDMAHSPAYFLADGVADHDFSWVHATEAKITDPVIQQLLDKVRVGAPPTANVEQYKQGATVTIRTKDGRTFSNTVYAPKGAGVR